MRKNVGKFLALLCALGMTISFGACAGLMDTSSPSSSGDSSNGSSSSPTDSSSVVTPECEHIYDNACDEDCNECGDIRIPSAHIYDNEYDGECNTCGDKRDVPEDPVNGGNWTGEVPLK